MSIVTAAYVGGGTLVKYNKLVLTHQLGESFWRTLMWRRFRVQNEKPFRYYYIMRNLLFLMRDYPELRLHHLRTMCSLLVKMLLYEPQKWQKIYYTLCGWRGFFCGEKGAMPQAVWRG